MLKIGLEFLPTVRQRSLW